MHKHKKMENYQEKQKKNNGIIYFLIVAVIALLGVTLYLFSQKKKVEQKIVYVTDERTKLQTEVDQLTASLKDATGNISKLNSEMQVKQQEFQQKLAALSAQLRVAGPAKLAEVKRQLAELKELIAGYVKEIEELKKQNQELTVQRDSLKTTVVKVSEKAAGLERDNLELSTKAKAMTRAAAALKATNIVVQTLKVKGNGKEVVVAKAKKTKKVKLSFKIHQNNIAQKGLHDVHIRILDAAGNTLEGEGSGSFNFDNQDLAYTYKTSIDFTNDDKDFEIEWTNAQPFVTGEYSIMLYSDGFIMGQAKFILK